jgi:threonine/homoserine/homoserine lactone efflux protein
MFSNHFVHMLLAALALPYALVLMVPGPNLFVVLRASLAPAGRTAFPAALGIALGASLAAATASIIAVFMPNNRFIVACGVLMFSFFLLRAAAALICNATSGGRVEDARSAVAERRGHFGLGLLSALFNPVTVPFFVGIFLAHPHLSSMQATLAACATVFTMAVVWFGALGIALARSKSHPWLKLDSGWLRYCVALGLFCYAILALSRLWAG